jgi:hypothetical protein
MVGTSVSLKAIQVNNLRFIRTEDLCPYWLITKHQVFVEQTGSGIQKISGPLFTAKVASLIFSDWLSLTVRRSLEIFDFQSTESS